MLDDPSPYRGLVASLERLVARDDRAALATLRSSLREGRSFDALRYVLPFLGKAPGRRAEDDACLLAGLFALHPASGPLSLAAALRRVREAGSESTEARFLGLLAANRLDLPNHLRHAVALAAGKNIPIDWNDLLTAIRYWDHDDDFVRRRWASDFWAEGQPAVEALPDEAPSADADQ